MDPASPSGEMTVDTVLTRWPALAQTFIALRTACVGCPMARFCTLDDVARVYGMPSDAVVGRLADRSEPDGPGTRT